MKGLALFYLIIGLNDLENTAKNFVELEISGRIKDIQHFLRWLSLDL